MPRITTLRQQQHHMPPASTAAPLLEHSLRATTKLSQNHDMNITPGQAHYVITRLLNDKRITHQDITRALQHLNEEIRTIEERIASLQSLRATRSPARTASNTIASNTAQKPKSSPKKRRHFSAAARAKQQLQGSYLGYMRQLPKREKARFQTIRTSNGFAAAIKALKKHLGK